MHVWQEKKYSCTGIQLINPLTITDLNFPGYIWVLIAFLSGSLPFSFWLGKIFMRLDVRNYGDGNPGATNVFRAGNWLVGILALILDISKAVVPVALAYHHFNVQGLTMVLIALAPILGHVFSPFLQFKGGKALAPALGVWIGLMVWQAWVPGIIAALIGFVLLTPPGWSIMLALAVILAMLLIGYQESLFIWIWVGEAFILMWTHRVDLRHVPKLKKRSKKTFAGEEIDRPVE